MIWHSSVEMLPAGIAVVNSALYQTHMNDGNPVRIELQWLKRES